MNEMQPVQLTGQGINPTLNREGNIMPDATNAEQNAASPLAGMDTSGLNPRQILDALQVIQRLTPEQIRALRENLEREANLPPEERRTRERERQEARDRERAAAPPPAEDPATADLRTLDPSIFSDTKLQRVAEQAQELVENREVYSSQIDRLIAKARDMRLEGADKAEYERLVGSLRTAYERAKREERIFTEQSDIEMISAHPLLKAHLEAVTQFFTKIKKEGKVDEAERTALVEAIHRTEMPSPRIDPEHPATFVSEAEDRLRSDFDLAKATLLGNIAEALDKVTGGEREEEFSILVKELVNAVEVAERDGNYDLLEEVISPRDIESPLYSRSLDRIVKQLMDERYEGKYDHVLEFALEYALERIVGYKDVTPQEEYGQFNLYQSDNIDRITQTARIYDESRARLSRKTKLFPYLVNLQTKRRIMHELFRSMKDPNTYIQFVTQHLRKTGFKFVEKEIAGVSDVQIIYEQVLGSALSFKSQRLSIDKGWLTDQDFAKADEVVEAQLKESARLRPGDYNKRFKKADGTEASRTLREWELDRAALMGRSLSAASMRRLVYAVLGDLPENPDILYKSLESERLSRRLAPVKLLADRFFGHPEAKMVLDLIHKELKRDKDTDKIDDTKYGYLRIDPKDGKLKPIGLYGQSQDAFDILDLLITDPKSNSWRVRNMFLKQKDYQTERIGNQLFTIGEYLDLMKLKYPYTTDKRNVKHYDDFNKNVRDVISRQRLFLGILMRYPELDSDNKAIIWQNVARFTPSRIAAFFPQETIALAGGEVNWIRIRNKLWLAERLRVKHDAEALKNGGATKDLHKFFEDAGITDQQEKDIIEALQNFGHDKNGREIVKMPGAKEIAKIAQPFTSLLEDAPKTDWEEASDEDFDRILVGDHNDFYEGYGHLMNLIANPIVKPEELAKALLETKNKIQGPPGLDDAQKALEPFINALLKARIASNPAKWGGAIMQAFRKGRSEVEKLNLQAKIADDEEQQRDILATLAQNEVISDNPKGPKDKKGRTQYVRMLDVDKANRKHQLYRMFRLLTLLFGPIFAKNLLKTIFGDLKDLGLE